MRYKIEDIEEAVMTALENGKTSESCKTIDSYHGEVDDLIDEFKAGRILKSLPAVFVLYAGSAFIESANRSFDEEMNFSVVLMARNLRDKKDLSGAMYPLIEGVKQDLIDNDFELNIEPAHPVSIEAVMVAKGLSIYRFDIKTSFSMD